MGATRRSLPSPRVCSPGKMRGPASAPGSWSSEATAAVRVRPGSNWPRTSPPEFLCGWRCGVPPDRGVVHWLCCAAGPTAVPRWLVMPSALGPVGLQLLPWLKALATTLACTWTRSRWRPPTSHEDLGGASRAVGIYDTCSTKMMQMGWRWEASADLVAIAVRMRAWRLPLAEGCAEDETPPASALTAGPPLVSRCNPSPEALAGKLGSRAGEARA